MAASPGTRAAGNLILAGPQPSLPEGSMSRDFLVRDRKRLYDGFFKLDELVVAHQQLDGKMSADQRRLVFERGDAVAILLMNLDTGRVVLVEQFKAPTLGKGQQSGWIVETVAWMIDPGESALAAAVRETMEETGYQIEVDAFRHLATFFSSPGGTSERIFLYYAEVRDADRRGKGGGIDDEDISVLQVPPAELFARLRSGSIEDPKLIIAALSLQDELRAHGRKPLPASTVRYRMKDRSDQIIGYKTGPISKVSGVSIWVNSENEDMIMDRFIGKSISANIRYLGSDKDPSGNVVEDTISDELMRAVGGDRLSGAAGARGRVPIGTVMATGSGSLASPPHEVQRILHVATVRGVAAGLGFRAVLGDLGTCTTNVLRKANELNERHGWIKRLFRQRNCESILFPMIGAGDGGLDINEVVPELVGAAVRYFRDSPKTTLKEIYLLAYTSEHQSACDRELELLVGGGLLDK
jgi:nudix-type nucleoside diphosphatase (YffH/AdpP family)